MHYEKVENPNYFDGCIAGTSAQTPFGFGPRNTPTFLLKSIKIVPPLFRSKILYRLQPRTSFLKRYSTAHHCTGRHTSPESPSCINLHLRSVLQDPLFEFLQLTSLIAHIYCPQTYRYTGNNCHLLYLPPTSCVINRNIVTYQELPNYAQLNCSFIVSKSFPFPLFSSNTQFRYYLFFI